MARFGHRNQRRNRASRLAIGSSHGTVARVTAALRDRGTLARLLLCFIAIAVMTVVVEGWKSPFRYRLGTRPPHGVLATVDFDRINHAETDRSRIQAEHEVPLHFQRQPLSKELLTDWLRADFQAIREAESLEELISNNGEVVTAFNLNQTRQAVVTVGADVKPDAAQAVDVVAASDEIEEKDVEPPTPFQSLRDLLRAVDQRTNGGPEQARIERGEVVLAEFQRILRVLDRPGIIDPEEAERERIRPGQRLTIGTDDDTANEFFDDITGMLGFEKVFGLSSVELPAMLKPGGRIAAIWSSMPLLSQVRPQMESWLLFRVEPTMRFDRSATQVARLAARESVEIQYEKWYAGQVLVGPGETIDAESLDRLYREYLASESLVEVHLRIIRIGTAILMIFVLAVINGYYLVRNERMLIRSYSRLAVYLGAMILAVGLGRWAAAALDLRAEIVPVMVIAMIVAVAYNQVMAALTSLTVSMILTLSIGGDLANFIVLISVSATAVILLTSVPSRSTLIKVGFVSGVAYLTVYCGLELLSSHSIETIWSDGQLLKEGLKGAAWCLASGFFVAGSLPFVERAFGVVTDISLLEMSDISHPLLQELVRRAPGTYNHSISVASIAETAAEAIGANGLLVRVAAYFHDIGKMLKPEYFIENITEGKQSRHTDLAPAMSTLIIIGHVKDGADLAHEHHLPQTIIDFIEQHHGTTLVQYFYHAAKKQAENEPDHRTDAEEASFRYPGPKPQTREAGVMMLADAVESASRTLSEPTPKRIETLVHKITMDKLLDGQFEESPLTLREIHTIEESLTQSLIAIYHGRIKYPERSAG